MPRSTPLPTPPPHSPDPGPRGRPHAAGRLRTPPRPECAPPAAPRRAAPLQWLGSAAARQPAAAARPHSVCGTAPPGWPERGWRAGPGSPGVVSRHGVTTGHPRRWAGLTVRRGGARRGRARLRRGAPPRFGPHCACAPAAPRAALRRGAAVGPGTALR